MAPDFRKRTGRRAAPQLGTGMKKTYILILEFEAEIKETLHMKSKKKGRYLKLLLDEFLKSERGILDIYRLWVMLDLGSDNHIYEFDRDMGMDKGQDEHDFIKSMVRALPDDAQTYFKRIFARDRDSIDRHFESFFDRFGALKVTKANFLEKGK